MHQICSLPEFLKSASARRALKIFMGYAGGSGSAYIMGLCDKLWRANMTEQECQAFVHKAVTHAMARDGSSGVSSLMLQTCLPASRSAGQHHVSFLQAAV